MVFFPRNKNLALEFYFHNFILLYSFYLTYLFSFTRNVKLYANSVNQKKFCTVRKGLGTSLAVLHVFCGSCSRKRR